MRAHTLRRLETGNTLTSTRRPRKLLDDPEQLFEKPLRHIARQLTYSLNFWHCVSVGTVLRRRGRESNDRGEEYMSKRWMLVLAFAVAVLAGCASISADQPGLERIEHIVVIYAENRSFDHMYGSFPGAEGIAQASAE